MQNLVASSTLKLKDQFIYILINIFISEYLDLTFEQSEKKICVSLYHKKNYFYLGFSFILRPIITAMVDWM